MRGVERLLKTGIHIVFGVPGTGKSYKGVKLGLDQVIKAKRPAYTNLPFKMKRMRAFIMCKAKGSKAERRAIARLLRVCTKGHFVRYCQRLGLIDEWAEKILDKQGGRGGFDREDERNQTKAREWAIRIVRHKLGPERLTGSGADWFPPGSVFLLDEVHKWFPTRNQKEEPKEIMDWASMHRHFLILAYLFSQRAMNISLSFRSMVDTYIFCFNKAKVPILWFIRLPFNAFTYVYYNSEDVDAGKPVAGAKPTWSETEIPALTGGLYYTLYASYSHAGSIAKLMKQLNEVRQAAGVSTEKSKMLLPGQGVKRRFRWVRWAVVACAIVGLVMVAAAWRLRASGTSGGVDTPVKLQARTQGGGVPPGRQDQQQQEKRVDGRPEKQKPSEPPRLAAVLPKGVIIDGRYYELGERFAGFQLVAVDPQGGRSAWRLDSMPGPVFWSVGRRPDIRMLEWRSGWGEVLNSSRTGGGAADPAPAGHENGG